MRTKIIAGRFKNSSLVSPRSMAVRPTLGRIRENLFNILGPRVVDARFLDLYAGLGSVGLEALSRGAKRCVFVENARACLTAIQSNVERLGVKEQCEIIRNGMPHALKRLEKRGDGYEVIFADPPYGKGWAERCLTALGRSSLFRDHSLIVIQTGRREELQAEAGGLILTRREDYGATSLWFYEVRSEVDGS